MHGVVYDPPGVGLPFLAVVLDNKGEVVTVKAVPSAEYGEAFIAEMFQRFVEAKARGEF